MVRGSWLWRSMKRPLNDFQPVFNWEVWDGSTILFWLDTWLLDQPLRNVATGEISGQFM